MNQAKPPSLTPRIVSNPVDVRNLMRGYCTTCGEEACSQFLSVSGRVLCDYCGCPPARHELLADLSASTSLNESDKQTELLSEEDSDFLSDDDHPSSRPRRR